MPISVQSAYGLTWAQVSGIVPINGYPFIYLTGTNPTIGPNGGVVVIAGIDQTDAPDGYNQIIQIFSPVGTAFGSGSAIVTSSADVKGKVTYLNAGVETNAFTSGIRLNCILAHLATYYIVVQLGNNVPDPDPNFNRTPPPPRKTITPTVTSPNPDDEWGSVTITWTTLDDLDTEVMGFRVWIHANYPGAVAYIVGNVPALSAIHPNYSFTYAIGANEYPDPNYQYTFTVEPYLFDPEPLNDPPTGTLGEESDESDPVIFFPDGSPPIPPEEEEPDIELPPLDPETGLPIPGVPVDSEDPDDDLLAPGTLTGAGYGGFNLGGSSLEDAVFIMNPSGIYTLVEGKTHDTLYERMTGITSQNVKIPDPFAKTGFI